VVSFRDMISVTSVETPVIRKVKELPGAFARVRRSLAMGTLPSEQTSIIVAAMMVRPRPIRVGPK